MPFLGQIMGESAVDLATKELVIVRVSQLNGCRYCLAAHRPIALEAGVAKEQLEAVCDAGPLEGLPARARAIVAWVDQVTRDAGGVTDELVAQTLDHRPRRPAHRAHRARGNDHHAQPVLHRLRHPAAGAPMKEALARAVEEGRAGDRLWVYATYHCNLACVYCLTESSPRIANRRTMSHEAMVATVAEARELGFTNVGITGGEAFMLPWFAETLVELSTILPTVTLTNATLFTDRLLDRLEPLAGLDAALQISLDSDDPARNDTYRGKDNFAQVMQCDPTAPGARAAGTHRDDRGRPDTGRDRAAVRPPSRSRHSGRRSCRPLGRPSRPSGHRGDGGRDRADGRSSRAHDHRRRRVSASLRSDREERQDRPRSPREPSDGSAVDRCGALPARDRRSARRGPTSLATSGEREPGSPVGERRHRSRPEMSSWVRSNGGRAARLALLLLLGGLLVALQVRLRGDSDVTTQIVGQLVAFALFVPALVICWRGLRVGVLGLVIVLAFAVGFRAAAFVPDETPPLSTDVHRYAWDARVQANGINPYRFAPIDAALRPLRDRAVFTRVNLPSWHTVYPPGAEAAFLAARGIFGTGLRSTTWLFLAGEAVTAALLVLVLARMSSRPPLERVAAYAWHPLAISEIAANGHVDALAVTALAALLAAWQARRFALAGVAVALAALVKLGPILLVPSLARRGGRWFVVTAIAVCVLFYIPYLSVGTAVFGDLAEYVRAQQVRQRGVVGARASSRRERGDRSPRPLPSRRRRRRSASRARPHRAGVSLVPPRARNASPRRLVCAAVARALAAAVLRDRGGAGLAVADRRSSDPLRLRARLRPPDLGQAWSSMDHSPCGSCGGSWRRGRGAQCRSIHSATRASRPWSRR